MTDPETKPATRRYTQTRWLALIAMTLLLLYVCWLIFSPFVQILMWAAVLAVVAQPLSVRLRGHKNSKARGAALATLAVLLCMVLPIVLVGALVVREATGLVPTVERMVKELPRASESAVVRRIDRFVDVDPYFDPDFLREKARAVAGVVVSSVTATVGSIAIFALKLLITLLTLFFLLRDGERVVEIVRQALPVPPERADEILHNCREVTSASLVGVLVIAAAQAALVCIAFLFLGVPSPFIWSVAAFLGAMIPGGPFLVWGPMAVFLLVTGHPWKAAILAGWGVVIVGAADNVLRPILVGKRTRLHELVVLFAVIGGLQVFGMLGIIVGPVTVVVTIAVLQALFEGGVTVPVKVVAIAPAAEEKPVTASQSP